MKKVAVISKVNLTEALELATSIFHFLEKKGVQVFCEDKMNGAVGSASCLPASQLSADADLVVVVGGDGTMLHASRIVDNLGIPILGIKMGRLGFLAETSPTEAFDMIEKALAGQVKIDERMRLHATVSRKGNTIAEHKVLNDVVINMGRLARIIDLQIEIGGQVVSKIRADGLIIATPTGSTAYNLAAGGPIVYPSLGAIVVTPICPHMLSFRPILVDDEEIIRVTVIDGPDALLTADGQVGNELVVGDVISITRSKTPCRLVVSERGFFTILHNKLNWAV